MYEIVKNVLNSGGYDLTAIIKKIDSLWVQGKLTDSEYNELISSARNGAKTEHSVDILTKLEELDKRLKVLENFEAPSDSTEGTVEEYAVGKWYYKGDKVFFEGKAYVCTAPEDTVCVWSPKEYPAYWSEVS